MIQYCSYNKRRLAGLHPAVMQILIRIFGLALKIRQYDMESVTIYQTPSQSQGKEILNEQNCLFSIMALIHRKHVFSKSS